MEQIIGIVAVILVLAVVLLAIINWLYKKYYNALK